MGCFPKCPCSTCAAYFPKSPSTSVSSPPSFPSFCPFSRRLANPTPRALRFFSEIVSFQFILLLQLIHFTQIYKGGSKFLFLFSPNFRSNEQTNEHAQGLLQGSCKSTRQKYAVNQESSFLLG